MRMLFALGRDRASSFFAMLGNTLLCLIPNQALSDFDRSEDVIDSKREGRYHEASAHIADFKLNRSLMPLQERGTHQHPRHSNFRVLQDQDRCQHSAWQPTSTATVVPSILCIQHSSHQHHQLILSYPRHTHPAASSIFSYGSKRKLDSLRTP